MQLCLSSFFCARFFCQYSPKPWNHRREKRRMHYDRSSFNDAGTSGGFRACQVNLTDAGEMSGEIPPCVAEAA